ncbi:probable DNA metabolism protein [Mariniphaga anaerophila]|uniref:Probable DNA metabolism protein n=1 Tax=Mariniphaga anaerophila TaxID=1484053 RepID=A0A1M4Y4C0_9BACT|nr:TIGR03915 family putative DNA repair protein [Mariniphaga anaerophila]SHF00433.1 probable DNA metabolism protein [Mariniphaga anaerophila]
MLVFYYDGTFEGLLTCIFEAYDKKLFPGNIEAKGRRPEDLFAESIVVHPDSEKARRVWKGIRQKLSVRNQQLLYYAFLSEDEKIEIKIFRFVRRLFREEISIETDFGDPDVLDVVQLARKVKKEGMRMMQFVRFRQTKDGLYFCGIEPLYDVLPLALWHFKNRFADQPWLLYDLKRNYGALYNTKTVEEVVLTSHEINRQTGQVNENVLKEEDAFYKTLWKSYFENINIKERKNLRLQRQHMPRRFWKYLTEKQK